MDIEERHKPPNANAGSLDRPFDRRELLLEAELVGENRGSGTTAFVCDPTGLAVDVRNTVSALGRHDAIFCYVEEAFSW